MAYAEYPTKGFPSEHFWLAFYRFSAFQSYGRDLHWQQVSTVVEPMLMTKPSFVKVDLCLGLTMISLSFMQSFGMILQLSFRNGTGSNCGKNAKTNDV